MSDIKWRWIFSIGYLVVMHLAAGLIAWLFNMPFERAAIFVLIGFVASNAANEITR